MIIRLCTCALLLTAVSSALPMRGVAQNPDTNAKQAPGIVRSDPGPSAILSEPPQQIRLWFSVPIEHALTQISLTDAAGKRVATGPAQDEGNPNMARADILTDVAAGAYVVAWSTITGDGLPFKGSFAFRLLGATETVDSAFAAQVVAATAEDSASRNAVGNAPSLRVQSSQSSDLGSVESLRVLARALTYSALVCVIGAIAFRLFVIPSATGIDAATERRMSAAVARTVPIAAVVYLIILFVRLSAEEVLIGGLPTEDISLKWATIQSTSFGATWMMRAFGMMAVLAGVVLGWSTRKIGWWLAAMASIVVALGTAQSVHSSSRMSIVAVLVETVHILAVSAWIGGLLWLLLSGLVMDASDTMRRAGRFTRAFAPLGIAAMATSVITGLVSAWIRAGSATAIIGTTYGIALIVKVVLSGIAVALALTSWRVARESGSSAHAGRFARLAMIQIGLASAAVMITSLLVALALPRL